MTYLFLVTAIALLTSVSRLSIIDLLLLNGLICLVALIVDTQFLQSNYRTQTISYEKIDNIKPANSQLLLNDLTARTGLNIVAVEILHIDFLKDCAELNVKYLPTVNKTYQPANQTSQITESNQSNQPKVI